MNEAQQAWLDELRSGRHTKCTGSLRKTSPNGDDRYCALGLANVSLGGEWELFDAPSDGSIIWKAANTNTIEDDHFLPNEFIDALGLDYESEKRVYRINDALIEDLEDETRTFEEIADILEAFFNGDPLPDL